MSPDAPIETHGFRLKQLEQWREGASKRIHDIENDCAACKLHVHEQLTVNRDIEERMRDVEKSSLKNGLIILLIGSMAGIGGSALLNFILRHV